MNEIKKVLMTGSAGHAGTGIASFLSKHYDLYGFDIKESPNCQEKIIGDVSDIEQCRKAIKEMDAVVINHMGGGPGVYDPPFLGFDINVRGTANIYQACLENDIKKVILISSVKTCADVQEPSSSAPGSYLYGSGVNIYAVTKVMQEHLAFHFFKLHGIVTTVIRPAWVVMEKECFSKGKRVISEYDKFMSDPQDIGEVVSICLRRNNTELEAFIVGQPEYTGVAETMEQLNWEPKYRFEKLKK